MTIYPQFFERPIIVVVRANTKEETTRQKILFYKITDAVSATIVNFLDIPNTSSQEEIIHAIVQAADLSNISIIAIESLTILADSTKESKQIIRSLIASGLKIFTISNSRIPLVEIQLGDRQKYLEALDKVSTIGPKNADDTI